MSESKSKRTFKKNEIILLSVLGALIYIGIVGKLLLLPELNRLKETQMTLENTELEYAHVSEQMKNLPQLKKDREAIKKSLLSESLKIPPVIDRERILLSMCAYSRESNASIESYSFSGYSIYPFEKFEIGASASNQALDPSQIDPNAEVMIVSNVEMRFTAAEEGLYKFLKAFEANEPSLYLKSCSIESSSDTGELTGLISMEYLAYKGKLAAYAIDLGITKANGKTLVFPSSSDVIEKKQQEEKQRIQNELSEYKGLKELTNTATSTGANK